MANGIVLNKKQALSVIELLEDADYNIKDVNPHLSERIKNKVSFIKAKINEEFNKKD